VHYPVTRSLPARNQNSNHTFTAEHKINIRPFGRAPKFRRKQINVLLTVKVDISISRKTSHLSQYDNFFIFNYDIFILSEQLILKHSKKWRILPFKSGS